MTIGGVLARYCMILHQKYLKIKMNVIVVKCMATAISVFLRYFKPKQRLLPAYDTVQAGQSGNYHWQENHLFKPINPIILKLFSTYTECQLKLRDTFRSTHSLDHITSPAFFHHLLGQETKLKTCFLA